MRAGRLVRTWNVWLAAAAMTPNTRATKSSGTLSASMNRSDMLLTNTRRGLRHCRGFSSRSGHSRTSKPCSNGCSGTPRHRSANVRA
jgi:hypothetical protein